MNDQAGDDKADRIENLERETERLAGMVKQARSEVRALQWLVAGVAILGAAVFFYLHDAGILKLKGLGSSVEKKVEAEEYGLYNRAGTRVMLTDYDKFGFPNLVFMDLKKNYKMGIKVWPDGGGTPGMVFYDDTGIRGNWRMDENNATVLNLMGRHKVGGISLAVSAEGDPTLTVKDKEGRVVFQVPQTASQAASVAERPQGRRESESRRPVR
jgi:hypothetical protein